MKLTKEEFEIIFWIEYMGYNYPERLSETMEIPEEEAKKRMKQLEAEGLITITIREKEIYGSQLTEKGKEIWDDKQYNKWKEDLGY